MDDYATCSKSYQEFVKFGKFFTTRLVSGIYTYWSAILHVDTLISCNFIDDFSVDAADISKLRTLTHRLEVQAVVQARLGQLIVQTCSVQPDPADWFSVRIDELGEVAAQIRTSVTKYPPNASCFTLDFLLHTADGDILPLESWCVRYEPDLVDDKTNIRTELYHQLGTLLKSAIVASRMTPAYRYYVRKQSPETFILMYRVYEKEPEMDLGEGYKKLRVGMVASPYGGFAVDLLYRTKMEIDRTPQELKINMEVPTGKNRETNQRKFNAEAPLSIPFGPVPASGGALESVSPVPELISNFSVDVTKKVEDSDLLFGTPRRVHFHLGRSRSSSDNSARRDGDENLFEMDRSNSPPYSSSLPHQISTAKGRTRTHSFPFSTLLTTATSNLFPNQELPDVLEDNDRVIRTPSVNENNTPPTSPNSVEPDPVSCTSFAPARIHQCATVPSGVNLMNTGQNDQKKSDGEAGTLSDDDDMTSSDDSYVKVAFGSSEAVVDGLGEFMKQCRSAPTHLSFQIDSTSNIPELLAQFENNRIIFDNFLAEINKKTLHEEDS